MSIVEYRGVRGLCAAEVLTDNASGITFGTPFEIAGTAEISKAANSSVAAHFYDNVPAVIVAGKGADVLTINTSAIPLDVMAKITGQYYDQNSGLLVEGNPAPKYHAIGYITEDTSGNEVFVWRLKGMFAIPDQTNATKTDGTDANGQTLIYTSIHTLFAFAKNGKNAAATVVDIGLGQSQLNINNTIVPMSESAFFAQAVTPDMVIAAQQYTMTVTPAAGAPVTVTRNNGAPRTISEATTLYIFAGDQVKVAVTGGTLTLNSNAWASGDIHVVTGNVTVTSTASE